MRKIIFGPVEIACLVVVFGIFGAVDVAAFIIGSDALETYQCDVENMSIGLRDFLIIGGSVGIAILTVISIWIICSGITYVFSVDVGRICFLGGSITLVLCLAATSVFEIAWSIIGIILLLDVSDDCKKEQVNVWGMSIAYILLKSVAIVSKGYLLKWRKRN